MKQTIVSALAVLGLSLGAAPEASGQRVRAGASLRLFDDFGVTVSYGVPYSRRVYVGRGYRYRVARYWEARRRHHRAHRKLDRQHDRWHRALQREHDALHRDMRRGLVSRREHQRWHEAVGYDHDALHHELDHRHETFHDRPYDRSRDRGRKGRHSH